ncbi:MAG TPA: AAA family ATPase [Candidatus Limnocylindria bacterium]|nr:AAA family ATPase [Candidatus Limnocylindria bacterium]
MNLSLPADALVVLIGPSGAGKSTFAARHFAATEVLSSDAFRAMVADDPNDQSATDAAFELLHTALALRLGRGRLAVVDATNVEPWARERLLPKAGRHRRQAVAIVFDLPLALCLERNVARTDRRVPAAAVRRQHARMRASMPGLADEGFAVVTFGSADEVDAARVTRRVAEARPAP